MAQTRPGSLSADKVSRMDIQFNVIYNKIKNLTGTDLTTKILKTYADYQKLKVEGKTSKKKQYSSALTTLQQIFNFCMEAKIPTLDINEPEFKLMIKKYWDTQIDRPKYHCVGGHKGNKKLIITKEKLNPVSVDKIGQQLRPFCKFIWFLKDARIFIQNKKGEWVLNKETDVHKKPILDLKNFESKDVSLPPELALILRPPAKEEKVKEPPLIDINQLYDFCNWLEKRPTFPNARLLCYLILLSETGARPTEMLCTNIGSIEPMDKDNTDILKFEYQHVKANQLRRTVLIYSKYYLENWLGHHPNKHDPHAPLFCNVDGSVVVPNTIIKHFGDAINEYNAEIRKYNGENFDELPKKEFILPKGQKFRLTRHSFTSRALTLPPTLRSIILGWSIGRADTYFDRNHPTFLKQLAEHLTKMLKEENNPFLQKNHPHWLAEALAENEKQRNKEVTKTHSISDKELTERIMEVMKKMKR